MFVTNIRLVAPHLKMTEAEFVERMGINGSRSDIDNVRLTRVPIRRVPVYRMLPASRLGGPEDTYAGTDEPDEYRELPAPSQRCAVIQIDGDCMEPAWPNKCYAMVDFDRTAGEGLIPGAAYYVQLRGEGDGKATFKRYVGTDGDEEVFDCINKKKYPRQIRVRGNFNAAIAVARVDWMIANGSRADEGEIVVGKRRRHTSPPRKAKSKN